MRDSMEVIVITDGDKAACRAVEQAGRQLNLRTISISSGNPTPIDGKELVELIRLAPHYPVLVMVDDCGNPHEGQGEEVLKYLANHPEIKILGVIAVASNIQGVKGVKVDFSIDFSGRLIKKPVDKNGVAEIPDQLYVEGDTVDVLNKLDIPLIIGIGDAGKMNGWDDVSGGALITTRAIEEILHRSGVNEKTTHQ